MERKSQKKIKNWVIILCLFLSLSQKGSASASASASKWIPKNEEVPAVIIFGDSIVDPGNNNFIKTLIKCNFQPYGRNFNGGLPTGRFSNGKIPSDIIAEELGVKELLPAYLDPKLTMEDLLTGVSFASGASGYDPLTSKITSVLSLNDQLELFKEYKNKIKAAVGEEKASTILSKAIIGVCTGSDDIANTYFILQIRRLQYDVKSYTDLMIQSASSFLKQLYDLGGRRIAVIGVPAIGCVPSQRTIGGGPDRQCSQAANEAALLFNSKLSSLINSLGHEYLDAKFAYLDIYYPLLQLVQNPASYGFEVVDKGCCGTGNIEVSILCNPLSAEKSCIDADKYIFWDSYHPSQKAAQILTPQVIRNNIHKLF